MELIKSEESNDSQYANQLMQRVLERVQIRRSTAFLVDGDSEAELLMSGIEFFHEFRELALNQEITTTESHLIEEFLNLRAKVFLHFTKSPHFEFLLEAAEPPEIHLAIWPEENSTNRLEQYGNLIKSLLKSIRLLIETQEIKVASQMRGPLSFGTIYSVDIHFKESKRKWKRMIGE